MTTIKKGGDRWHGCTPPKTKHRRHFTRTDAPMRAFTAAYVACRALLDDNSRQGIGLPKNKGGRNRHQYHRLGGFFTFVAWLDQWSGHAGRLCACRFPLSGSPTRIALATTIGLVAAGFSASYKGILP